MATKAKPSSQTDPRQRTVDALLALCTEQKWENITLSDIAGEAGLSLADLRDLFPSKGAILGAFIRRIDRQVLEGKADDMEDQSARERVLDLMLRRFDALAPHRAALTTIHKAFSGNIAGLFALNNQALNSWRYMLESIGIETEGPLGLIRLQGAIMVFARMFPTFLAEEDTGLPRTMAMLDRELRRGEWVLARADGLARFLAPFRGFCRAARDTHRREQRNDEPATPIA